MEEQARIDQIAELADKADNLAHAALLPMPDHFHREQLTRGMEEIRDTLRAFYIAVTGENPWQ